MHFKENKRLKSQQDKDILKQFKIDIFNNMIPIEDTITKYFKIVKEGKTNHNIAYRNNTCQAVSQKVRSRLNKRDDVEKNEILVCRKFFKSGKLSFSVNYEYKITKILDNGKIQLDKTHELPLSMVKKYFTFDYCRTCHSLQGSSIDKKITIYDWKFHHVDRKWIYTAVTRATELKNVFFIDCEQDEEDTRLNKYLEMKINNYKKQDAGRKIDNQSYVNIDWFKRQFGKDCPMCGDGLTYDIEDGKMVSNLTANRIDNNRSHQLDNIEPMCCYCNTCLGNREI